MVRLLHLLPDTALRFISENAIDIYAILVLQSINLLGILVLEQINQNMGAAPSGWIEPVAHVGLLSVIGLTMITRAAKHECLRRQRSVKHNESVFQVRPQNH